LAFPERSGVDFLPEGNDGYCMRKLAFADAGPGMWRRYDAVARRQRQRKARDPAQQCDQKGALILARWLFEVDHLDGEFVATDRKYFVDLDAVGKSERAKRAPQRCQRALGVVERWLVGQA